MPSLSAIVLAAGQGRRMQSALSKVLHPLAGRPMVHYPVHAARELGAAPVVVVVSPDTREVAGESVRRAFGDAVTIAVQERPRGTADAVAAGLDAADAELVLVLCGDTPLVTAEALAVLVTALERAPSAELCMLTARTATPTGYGRVIRDGAGALLEVREERDLATDAERAISEVNSGAYLVRREALARMLAAVTPSAATGELYFTAVVADAAARGVALGVPGDPSVLVGVNDREQLHAAEEQLYRTIARRHRLAGATVRGDARIDAEVVLGRDVVVEAGVCLRGHTRVGDGALIDVGSVLEDAVVAPGARLRPYTIVSESVIGERAQIGPFSHLRPGSDIGEDAHVGNFVETKKTRLGAGAKANHLSYLGDGDVGARSNIGAGTIFCNYDGFRKHRTVLEEDVFIGSDSQLVAPLTVGQGAYVATGTTVTRDVPADAVAIGRVRQENKEGYASRLRDRLRRGK